AIGGALSKTHHQGDRGVVVRILQHGRNCAFWRPATANPRGSPPWRPRLESDRAAAHTHVPGYRRIGSRKRTACHLKLWIAQVSQGGSGLMISWCSPYWRDSFGAHVSLRTIEQRREHRSFERLGGHVGDRAGDVRGVGQAGRDSEVGQEGLVALRVPEDVGRLEVAVNDAPAVDLKKPL